MITYIIIALVVFILINLIILKVAKKLFKYFFLFSILLTIAFAVFGFIVYQDAMDLQKKFATEEKIILLKHQGQIAAGLQGVFGGGEEIVRVENIPEIKNQYQNDQFDEILGDNYKLIVINSSDFDDVETIYLIDQDRPLEEIFSYLESENVLDEFAVKLLQEKDFPITEETKNQLIEDLKFKLEIKNGDGFKGILFGLLLQNKQLDQFFLLNNEIYPETIIFKIIRIIPLDIIEGITQNIKNGNTE